MLDACQEYAWPGNLKELEAFVKRYLVAGEEELNFEELGLASADRNGNTVQPAVPWAEVRGGRESIAPARIQA